MTWCTPTEKKLLRCNMEISKDCDVIESGFGKSARFEGDSSAKNKKKPPSQSFISLILSYFSASDTKILTHKIAYFIANLSCAQMQWPDIFKLHKNAKKLQAQLIRLFPASLPPCGLHTCKLS